MANILELIHKGTGNRGRFLKEYQPTGKPKTTQIQLLNGQIFFAPSHEFEPAGNSESQSNCINKEKYEGIAFLEFEMTGGMFQVFERRKALANEIIKGGVLPNQILYIQEEIKRLDSLLKKFLFID